MAESKAVPIGRSYDAVVVGAGNGGLAADRKPGFIHPCSSYPLSDLELSVPSEA